MPSALDDGTYDVQATATDDAGNSDSITASRRIDGEHRDQRHPQFQWSDGLALDQLRNVVGHVVRHDHGDARYALRRRGNRVERRRNVGCIDRSFDGRLFGHVQYEPPLSASATPYGITYNYAANGEFNAISDSSTALTITKATLDSERDG